MVKQKLLIILSLLGLLVPSIFAYSVEVISTNPAPIIAGDYADITIRVTNIGSDSNDKKNLEFYFEKSQYFLPVNSENNKLSKLNSNEEYTKTLRVFFSQELEEGYVNLPLIINTNGIIIRHDLEVYVEDVKTKPEIYVGDIKTTPNELLPDTDNNLIIVTLQNLGDKDAELLVADLELITGAKESYTYSTRDTIATLEAGSSSDLEFTIDTDEDIIDVVKTKLNLRYRTQKSVGNNYETVDEIINLDIPISEAPKLIIESVEQVSDFKIGTPENILRLKIKNIGTRNAEEIRVRLSPDLSYPFVFEELTQYASSEIEIGEVVSIDFKTEVSRDAQIRNFTMGVVLESLVEDSRYTQYGDVSIQTMESKKASISGVAKTIILVVIAISLILGFTVFRKRSRSKKK